MLKTFVRNVAAPVFRDTDSFVSKCRPNGLLTISPWLVAADVGAMPKADISDVSAVSSAWLCSFCCVSSFISVSVGNV